MEIELDNYKILVEKLKFDLNRYSKNNSIYILLDCFFTLNALPEWIIKGEIDINLKTLVQEKISVMKGLNNFTLNEGFIRTDIDHQLRLIRLICNHAKHKKDAKSLPIIKTKYGGTLPATFPIKLYNIIAIGEFECDAEYIMHNVADFWIDLLEKV